MSAQPLTIHEDVDRSRVSVRLSQALETIRSIDDVGKILAALSCFFNDAYLTYQTNPAGAEPTVNPFIRTTYPAEWIKIYIQKGYFSIDPVIREGYKRTLPFDWLEIIPSNAIERAFFSDAKEHGVGAHGFSIPLTNQAGHRGLFSMNANCSQDKWDKLKSFSLSEILIIAQSLHQKVTGSLFISTSPSLIKLAPREIECLNWVAEGKDVPGIAIILSLSEHTIRSYLKSCRLKLGCATISQAVYKATKMDLMAKNS